MKKNLIVFIFLMIVFSGFVLSETNSTNQTDANATIPESHNITIIKIIPRTFNIGDAQFSIQVKNELNETQINVYARITGDGFSTYDVIPIDFLEAYSKGYMLVTGNFKKSGTIMLTIKINSETFYENVSVSSTSSGDIIQQEEIKKAILGNLTIELEKINENYTLIEQEIANKKRSGYDVSQISTSDLKKYIRDAQAGILAGDVQGAQLNINLAKVEYTDVRDLIDNAKQVSLITRIKDNAVLFSAIAGAVLTFFALYELLKNKKERISTHIKEIEVKKKSKKEEAKSE